MILFLLEHQPRMHFLSIFPVTTWSDFLWDKLGQGSGWCYLCCWKIQLFWTFQFLLDRSEFALHVWYIILHLVKQNLILVVSVPKNNILMTASKFSLSVPQLACFITGLIISIPFIITVAKDSSIKMKKKAETENQDFFLILCNCDSILLTKI